MRLPNGSEPGGHVAGGPAWLAMLVVLLALSPTAESAGKLSIQFLSYESGGQTASGASCDSAAGGTFPVGCDPQFRVVVDKVIRESFTVRSESVFIYQQAGFYPKRNTLRFRTKFGNLPNPLVIPLNYDDNQGSVWMEIVVTDIRADKSGELMSKFGAMLNVSDTETTDLALQSSANHSLTIRYWYSCDADYFGQLCNKHCVDETANGFCNSSGDKVCRYGWVDASKGCKKPHPCRTCDACKNGGVCVPEGVEGFKCHCQVGYLGDDCSVCHLDASQCGQSSSPADGICDPLALRGVSTGLTAGALVSAIAGVAAFALIGMGLVVPM